ncbi:hypothetical protein [Rhizosphaericola mali]|uniref:Glycosyltransferase n=1 Tax=Rhizosphaericola mali TaxID=2545455 RepID=A0A5P2G397_9BACT|nr:hypothetical protein [Rhizosphaericola mali]QES89198.1 hypothetical protein E0W69_011165 [Rhizosphaericola mali]
MTNKYILSFAPWVGTNAENGAMVKPKRDIIASAKELGFKEVLPMEDLHFNKLNIIRQTQIWRRFKRKFFEQKSKKWAINKNIRTLISFLDSLTFDDVLLVQYPIYGDHAPEILTLLLKRLPNLNLKQKIIIIHDIETLDRSYKIYLTKEEESYFIKSFDYVILHNQAMIDYFKTTGDTCTYISLDIFDYRLQENKLEYVDKIPEDLYSVFYAGNLMKSSFLKYVDHIPNFNFHVYGPNYNLKNNPQNLSYYGELAVDKIITEGSKFAFGLVWDGDSIKDLEGMFGTYMKYNNPYKFSCNIASGLPIITSKQAGIATFIEKNNLGILVDSLEDLNNLTITKESYLTMKSNVLAMRLRIINGDIFKDILSKILN